MSDLPSEVTGEAETLRNRIQHSMGDRVSYSKPPESLRTKPQAKPIGQRPPGVLYYPRTPETKQIYSSMLSFIPPYLGDVPPDILADALDNLLAVLKSTEIQEKKQESEAILGPLSEDDFSKLLLMSKQLNDYDWEEAPAANEISVGFQEEPQEEEDLEEPEAQLTLDPSDIDSNWLRSFLSEHLPNPDELEPQVLDALSSQDLRTCENKLVMLLGFDHFDLVTFFMHNKTAIYMCVSYHKADHEHKKHIINQLKEMPEGSFIIPKLATGASPVTPKKIIDLSSIEFDQGPHVMTNRKVVLPEGSTRTSNPGYEEVTIPAPPKPHQLHQQVRLLDMPEWVRPAFSLIKELNPIQSAVYSSALSSDQNLLICAPTGAGKTNIALLAILRVISNYTDSEGNIDLRAFKVVYVAPMKALVTETCGNLKRRLESYGVTVKELTGDMQLTRQQIQKTQVIVTTPEKWDIVTRKSGERTFTELVKLVIVDEIHLLHDTRGPVLEAVISRTLRTTSRFGQNIRLVGLSATLPNYGDVASFLKVEQEGLFFFDRSYRPVPLQQTYIGITEKKAMKRFLLMNEVCYEKLVTQAGKNQVLIFVHSRKETARTARALRDLAHSKNQQFLFLKEDSPSRTLLSNLSAQAQNSDLKDLLPSGFAVHHAGLSRDDRSLVEDLFADKHIQVLVSTSTLAWGVNLPAHTVILKGTQVYFPEKGCWGEVSPQDMLQMMGRAGRIDYDTEGEGIVITTQDQLQYYLSLLNTQLNIESQMVSALADNINAEVVLGTLGNFHDALEWAQSTYLYVRLSRDPEYYGFDSSVYSNVDGYLVDIVHSALHLLNKYGLVEYDRQSGTVHPTPLGQVSSHYYLKPDSISIYNSNLKPHMGPIDLLKVFSMSLEFKSIQVREEEKLEVAKLMERVPYPVKGSSEEASSKMNCLLQAYISRLKLEGYTLMSDMVFVSQSAGRIMRGIFEICLRKGWAQLAYTALSFCKMIQHRMWNVMTPLRQFKYLSEEVLHKIEKKEGLLWEHFYDMTEAQVSELVKVPNIGPTVHRLIHKFPKLCLNAYIQPVTRSCLRVELAVAKDFEWDQAIHGSSELFWVFVEDLDSEVILHYEQFTLKDKYSEVEQFLVFTVPIFEPLPPQYFIRVVSDRWIQSEVVLPVSFRHLILPEKFYPPSTLESQPVLPVSALKWPQVEGLLEISYFNLMQTQTFESCYLSDSSVLLCSPTGSGKTLMAELGLFRALSQGVPKILYLAQFKDTVDLTYRRWKPLLSALEEKVGLLGGSQQDDLKVLNSSRVILGTAEEVDMLTRKWRQRKAVRSVGLVIVEGIHLLGEKSSELEVVLSRLRYMSTQLESNIRILALGFSLANAKDVAEWIGVSEDHLYNFPPSSRPLKVTVQSFDHNYRSSRIHSMVKPVYANVKTLSKKGSVVVYVPDRKVARGLLSDLKKFIYQESLEDSLTVSILGESSRITIVPSSMVWRVAFKAAGAVVMDTCRYDGREHRYVDYSLSEMLEMCGSATEAVVVLCHTPKYQFLKKFLTQPFPLESHLDHYLADHFNSEVVAKSILSKQDAVDWITWTFLYRRLTQNPNYYNMQGITPEHINDHLSELVENTCEELEKAKCLTVVDEVDLQPLEVGIIAHHYYVKCSTLETYLNSLTPNSKIRGIVEVMTSATELENFPVRQGDNFYLRELNSCLPFPLERDHLNEPQSKCVVLLFSHFSRFPSTPDLEQDTKLLLQTALKLVHSVVDLVASQGWLFPALYAMNLSQMITQGLWDQDSPLLQLPYFTRDLVDKCAEAQVEDIVDLMNLEDSTRNSLLGFSEDQMVELASVCNAYPSIEMQFACKKECKTGEVVQMQVSLEREGKVSQVYAPKFPEDKQEYWWVLVGDPKSNTLLGIKKLRIQEKTQVNLEFLAPEEGVHELTLYLLCDCYMGADQGEKFTLTSN